MQQVSQLILCPARSVLYCAIIVKWKRQRATTAKLWALTWSQQSTTVDWNVVRSLSRIVEADTATEWVEQLHIIVHVCVFSKTISYQIGKMVGTTWIGLILTTVNSCMHELFSLFWLQVSIPSSPFAELNGLSLEIIQSTEMLGTLNVRGGKINAGPLPGRFVTVTMI